jgi:hypothetical protein
MAILRKKTTAEPIRKVNVKMVCGCYNQNCDCKCSYTERTRYDSSSTSFGPLDAELCKQIYDDDYAKHYHYC